METLRDFVIAEIDKRHMSIREFARLVGVANVSISAVINPGDRAVKAPSIDFLLKLAKATKTNVFILLVLAYPEVKPYIEALTGRPASDTLRLEQIERLSDDLRAAIDVILVKSAGARQGEDHVEGE
jgi:transcriptional regulator with XRE-family HTH domain